MMHAWTKHIKNADEKDRYLNSLLGSKWILNRLSELLQEMEEEINTSETNPKTYEVPNWDYRQAHNNGYRQAIRLIKRLINLDQKENNGRVTNPAGG